MTLDDYCAAARRRLPKTIFDFIEGGAGDESTVRANREAFASLTFRQRPLESVSKVDTTTRLFGHTLSIPVLAGPAGLARLVHSEGERAVARAARRAATAYVLSIGASASIEEVAHASAGGLLWFQVYLNWRSRTFLRDLLRRAAASGYGALCVTGDSPGAVRRPRDMRNGMTVPPRITPRNALEYARRFRWAKEFLLQPTIGFANIEGAGPNAGDRTTPLRSYIETQVRSGVSPTWDNLEWLRGEWPGPLVLKGVLTREAATRAFDIGVDGVVVSNHGGREFDGLPATLSVIPEIAEVALPQGKVVLVDGGFRSGADVLKGIALGAQAVLIARPYWWGLAVRGEEGVADVFDILRSEIECALTVLGRPTLSDINLSALSMVPQVHSDRGRSSLGAPLHDLPGA